MAVEVDGPSLLSRLIRLNEHVAKRRAARGAGSYLRLSDLRDDELAYVARITRGVDDVSIRSLFAVVGLMCPHPSDRVTDADVISCSLCGAALIDRSVVDAGSAAVLQNIILTVIDGRPSDDRADR